MTGTNFSSWYNASEGSFAALADSISSAAGRIISLNDGGGTNRIDLLRAGSGQLQLLTMADGASTSVGSVSAGGQINVSAAYKANDIALSLAGAASVLDATATVPTVTQINLGNNAAGSSNLNGHIARIAYFPRRLSNTELQALSS
jgi:hypothetical protein